MSKAPDRCPMCGEKSLITNTKFSRYAVLHTGYDWLNLENAPR